MKLRFVEDRRTLICAGIVLPLGPALALHDPAYLPWLAPLLLYASYLAGVLAHNHNHCPVFQSRRLNLAYGAWLSVFYGFPLLAWVPTHNQNHHRHVNGSGDVTSTHALTEADTLLAALVYPLKSSKQQLRLIARYVRRELAKASPQAFRLRVEVTVMLVLHLAVAALGAWLHGTRGVIAYLVGVFLPAALATYWMMLTNYLQHVGCDSRSSYGHSRNFVSPFWNWFVFDNGFHTVHHQHPGLHWSRYRALHRLAAARIDPALNHDTIPSYLVRRYVLGSLTEHAQRALEVPRLEDETRALRSHVTRKSTA